MVKNKKRALKVKRVLSGGIPLKKVINGEITTQEVEATPKVLQQFKEFKAEPEEMEWVIEGFLPKGIVGYIAGDPGTRKSLTVLEIIIRGALGDIGKGRIFPNVEIGKRFRSIYVSAEDPQWEVHKRVRSIVERIHPEYGLTFNQIFERLKDAYYYDLQGEGVSFFELGKGENTPQNAQGFFDFGVTVEKYLPDLVIIDTKSRVSFLRENSNEETAFEISRYEKLAKETDCTFLLIHHMGKAGAGPRGASSFHANCRFGMEFLFFGKDNRRSKKLSDNLQGVRVNHCKSSYSQTIPPFVMRWSGLNYEFITEKVDCFNDVGKLVASKKIKEYLAENAGATQQGIINVMEGKLTQSQVRLAIKSLKEKGVINTPYGARKGLYLNTKNDEAAEE
ncbi:MAG: AAA family ATPase [Chitinispirillaceae bacterium]|nr:AAA family ATPase [Chitinispirillaceae bacterium]